MKELFRNVLVKGERFLIQACEAKSAFCEMIREVNVFACMHVSIQDVGAA